MHPSQNQGEAQYGSCLPKLYHRMKIPCLRRTNFCMSQTLAAAAVMVLTTTTMKVTVVSKMIMSSTVNHPSVCWRDWTRPPSNFRSCTRPESCSIANGGMARPALLARHMRLVNISVRLAQAKLNSIGWCANALEAALAAIAEIFELGPEEPPKEIFSGKTSPLDSS